MYCFKKFKLLIILTALYKFESKWTICFLCLTSCILSWCSVFTWFRSFFCSFPLYSVFMTIQSCLQSTILQNYISSWNTNIKTTLTSKRTHRIYQFLSWFKSTIQIKFNVLLQELWIIIPNLLLRTRVPNRLTYWRSHSADALLSSCWCENFNLSFFFKFDWWF